MIDKIKSFRNFWFVGSRNSFVILESQTLNSYSALYPAIEGIELNWQMKNPLYITKKKKSK